MKVLLLNQAFYPDVVSSSQHLTDLALGLVKKGHQVTVITSRRGYDNPLAHFPKREVWKGVEIIRISSLGLGKKAKWRRAADFASFLLSCFLRLMLLPRYDVVVAMTSPPLISFLGALFTRLKGGRFVFWVLDLNPDEAIAAGWLRQESVVAKFLNAFLLYSIRHAAKVIALDRFMKERIAAKGNFRDRIVVIPPWSHDDPIRYDDLGRAEFREQHQMSEKYVVMYSGNHSPCHPLDTLLKAAERLSNEPQILFCFAGGGSEIKKVKAFARARNLSNIICLPYQPLDKLSASLSAADLHVVVMGESFAGIVHPCKVYNILRIGIPFLYIGPSKSHVTDILSQMETVDVARSAEHGEIETVVKHIIEAAQKAGMLKSKAQTTLSACYSKETLLPRMIEVLESVPNTLFAYNSAASENDAPAI